MRSRVADRYVIDAPIGRGRSTVYRGTDTRLGRPVALKEVRLASDDESLDRARRRALREARAAARLSHPSVVTVYDVIEEEASIWLVMELVDAPSLAQLVADRGRLDHARAALIGADVLGALEAAHAVGVVHRDVKPANVLVGLGQRAKLADFGVAFLHDDTRVTATGLVIGSPAYMAPEQALGEAVGPAADLWALGATLYFAYEGRPPFDGGTAVATASAVVHGSPRPERHPGPLSPIVARLLAKDPAERPTERELHQLLLDVAAAPAGDPTEATAVAVAVPAGEATEATKATESIEAAEATGATAATAAATGATEAVSANGAEADGAGGTPTAGDAEDAGDAEEHGEHGEHHEANDATEATAAVDVPATERREPVATAVAAPSPAARAGDEDREPPGRPVAAARRDPRQRRRVAVLVAAIVVAVLGLAWLVTFDPDDLLDDGGGGSGDDTATVTTDAPTETTAAAAAPPATQPEATTSTTAAPTTTTSTPSTTAAAPAAVPPGWQTYTHSQAGYTIAYPAGWQVEPNGRMVDIEDPNSATYLRIDWTDQPKDDPVADWKAQSQRFGSNHAGYREHRVEAYPYRDYNAAMWEYSWDSGGTRMHAGNLGFVAGARGYALNFVTTEADWAASQDLYRAFQDSFRP